MRRFLDRWRVRLFAPVLSSREAYARWAASYPPHAHNALMRSEEALMRQYFPDFRGRVVLDLACGSGRYGLIAQDLGAAQVIGCDNSPEMLAVNSLPYRALASAEAIPLPRGCIDLLLCGLALGHLPDPSPSLQEISRVLRPGGVALISDFHPTLYHSGGRRSFRDDAGHLYTVKHYPHSVETMRAAASQAGLHMTAIDEARVPGAPTPQPAVIVYRLEA